MAIGERIRFFRNLRNITQKYLGMSAGFPEATSEVRIAQYESGSRSPKADLTEKFARTLDVSPLALTVPDIDSYFGLMHTLFTLEDRYGLKIDGSNGDLSLRVDLDHGKDAIALYKMLVAWQQVSAKLQNDEISREEYDRWRYHYPEYDTTQIHAKVIPQVLSDALVKDLKDK